jgi:hypothetical protein
LIDEHSKYTALIRATNEKLISIYNYNVSIKEALNLDSGRIACIKKSAMVSTTILVPQVELLKQDLKNIKKHTSVRTGSFMNTCERLVLKSSKLEKFVNSNTYLNPKSKEWSNITYKN